MNAVLANPAAAAAPTSLPGIAKPARLLSFSHIIRRLLRVVINLLAARMLGVTSFGGYALLLAIIEMVALLDGYSYTDFLTREVARCPESAWSLGKKIIQLRLILILPGLGLGLLTMLALRFSHPLVLSAALLGLTLVPRAFSESCQGILKGMRRFTALPWIEFIQGVIVLVALPLLVLRGMRIRGVVASEIAGALGGATIAGISLVRTVALRSSSSSPALATLLGSIYAFNIYPFLTNIYDRVDVVLLARLAGQFATGIYSVPYRVFAAFQFIPQGIMGALLPVLSASKNKRDSAETCAAAMKVLLLLALLLVLITLSFAGTVIRFVLGNAYAGSIPTIQILVWAAIPVFLNFALNTLLVAADRERIFLRTTAACAVFNITSNLIAIPRYSFLGAAVVTLMTECLLLALNLFFVRRFWGRAVLPATVLGIVSFFTADLAVFAALSRVLPSICAGALACLAFFIFSILISAELRCLLRPEVMELTR